MKNFAIGCNYWASNAGAYTWRFFDREVVKKDFDLLVEHGVNTIRVFPLWPDFQRLQKGHTFTKVFPLRQDEKIPTDPDGLDKTALENFAFMLDEAEKRGIQVIVALVTGWMSGRWYAPEFLQNVNLFNDPRAIVWECRFAKAFVNRFKDRDCIVAWEPGNECNCLVNSEVVLDVRPEEAELWLSAITNAIRAEDNTRPIYSGMHSIFYGKNRPFSSDVLARYTDMQTTHPYPNFTPHCNREGVLTMRSALHAAAESTYIADITNQTCMVEEINTLGPMLLHDDFVPEFLDKTMFSSYQYGTTGYLWWCGFDQEKLDYLPYDEIALECNLGLCYSNQTAKPVTREMKKVAQQLQALGDVPPCMRHAIVVLSNHMQNWANAYGAFCLATQAGFTVEFMADNQPLKDSDYYIVPCLDEPSVPKRLVQELEEKIKNGAKALITYNGGYIYDFNELTGLKVTAKEVTAKTKRFMINGVEEKITATANLSFICDTAMPLIETDVDILLTENKYGKGSVFFCNSALENYYTETYETYKTNLYQIYKIFMSDLQTPMRIDSSLCAVTFHEADGICKVLITKFSDETEFTVTVDERYELVDSTYCDVKDGKIMFSEHFAVVTLKIARESERN